MNERSNRERTERAFLALQDGTGYIIDLLADDLRWTIVGRSRVSRTYEGKEKFVGIRFSATLGEVPEIKVGLV